MASDIQRGTRRMDASDWTRIKKLNGAKGNMLYSYTPTSPAMPIGYDDTINPSPINCCVSVKNNRQVYSEFGISKIRRPASLYTDYIASQTADFILETTDPSTGAKILSPTNICNCGPKYTPTIFTYRVTAINTVTLTLDSAFNTDATAVIFTSGITCIGNINYNTIYYPTYKSGNSVKLSATPAGTPGGSDIVFTGCGAPNLRMTVVTLDSPIRHSSICFKCRSI